MKINNKNNNLDIGYLINDINLANICRILLYENKNYDYQDGKLIDIDNFFNVGNTINIDNLNYDYLEKKYSKLIPLWETQFKNLKKYPELYNENWIEGKREQKRQHPKLLKLKNGFNLKVGYLWKKQPFDKRPTYNKKFVKIFKTYYNNEVIIEDENWGSILSKSQQYIKDNAKLFYDNYERLTITGYCKSEKIEFKIVEFDILENKWFI